MAELSDMKAIVEPGRELTDEQILRYSRHLLIPDIDNLGQRRINNAKVLCVGAGGLGSPTIMYLAAAGVGTIGIVDYDKVEMSNLQRQVIHGQSDIGKSKAVSAKEKVAELNPDVKVLLHEVRLDESNAISIMQGYDLIIDCTDNFATRYLINDAAALLKKPYIWGSVYRFDGQATVFWSEYGPCYRCLYPKPPAPGSVTSCAEGGVLGALCAVIGSIQTTEALKLITGIGEPLLGTLLIHNALGSTYEKVQVKKLANCPICSGSQQSLLKSYEAFCGNSVESITATELKEMFARKDDFILIDVREPSEFQEVSIPGAQLIPKGRFEDGSVLKELPKEKQIVLHCRSGVRSANCLKILNDAGFENAKHLEGGIIAWLKESE